MKCRPVALSLRTLRLYRGVSHTISPLITVITRHVFKISISGIFIMSADAAVRSAMLPQAQHRPAIRMNALNTSKEALPCGFRSRLRSTPAKRRPNVTGNLALGDGAGREAPCSLPHDVSLGRWRAICGVRPRAGIITPNSQALLLCGWAGTSIRLRLGWHERTSFRFILTDENSRIIKIQRLCRRSASLNTVHAIKPI
jgi:hypothetical protein